MENNVKSAISNEVISHQAILPKLAQSNFFKRVLLGSMMLPSFIILCKSKKIYMAIFVILLTLAVNYEIISIVKRENRPFSFSRILVAYFAILLFSNKVFPAIFTVFPQLGNYKLLLQIERYYFTLYTLGLMIYIFSLKKGRLGSQLLQLTITLISSYVMGVTCQFTIMNISRGSFYFFYPAVLVISNDIFAYFVGKLIGKTPLYSLSPNKTWEGFIGASFFTLLTGILLSYLKINYNFLPDEYNRYLKVPFNPDLWYLNFPIIYVHNLAFSCAASFIAPFFGFLASAIKRAFKKKDFGDVIPGHGGITDRMDCQLLMVFFTYFYVEAFIMQGPASISRICEYIRLSFSADEISEILERLRKNN